MTDIPAVKKIPMGVRALPEPKRPADQRGRVVAEAQRGKAQHTPRHMHLDEMDGDAFK